MSATVYVNVRMITRGSLRLSSLPPRTNDDGSVTYRGKIEEINEEGIVVSSKVIDGLVTVEFV